MTDEERALNFSLLSFFGISDETKKKNNFVTISNQVTERVWKLNSPSAINKAPPAAAYCAVEANEGRTIDVLYQGSSVLSGSEIGASYSDASVGFKDIAAELKMTYMLKTQGYTSKVPVSGMQSLTDVLEAVDLGAPYFWNVTLVATRNQERTVVEQKTTAANHFTLAEGYSWPYAIKQTGALQIEVRSSVGVSIAFDPTSACPGSYQKTMHLFACKLEQPAIMKIENPSVWGHRDSAVVDVSVVNTSTR